ncbi:MAG: TonB-dependent receptor [Kofleriaceae bacterium]|nr:TonB-dependent receptor [Kofleriaceae bacterium]
MRPWFWLVLASGGHAHAQSTSSTAEVAPETIVVDDKGVAPVNTPSAAVRIVGERALELTPHKNADDLLRVVPGLYMSQHGSEGKGQQFFLRGFDAVHGSDLAIRVGGIPLNEMSNVHGQGYADLGFVVPETVHGLTARKGPFDLEQGWFATAGSVDLELGTSQRGGRVGYELGTTRRHRLVVVEAPKDGPDAELVGAEVMHDDGFGQGRQTQKASVIGQTELTAGALKLRPLLVGHTSTFGEPGVIALQDIARGTFERTSAPAGDLVGESQRMLAGLGATWKHGTHELVATSYLGWRSFRVEQNFTGFLENEMYGDARLQQHRALTGGGRVAWRRRVMPWLRVLAGTEVLHDQIVQGEDRVSTQGEVWRNERSLAATTTALGVWAGAEAKRGPWIAVGGVRLDGLRVEARDQLDRMRDGQGTVGAVSPRLSIAHRTPAGSISLAVGRGVRPPEARAFTARESRENMQATVYDGGDPAITMANAVEVGGERRWDRVRLGLTGFATWIERESVFDHISGVNALKDGSRRFGVEAFFEVMPKPWLVVRGDVTAVDARYVVTENPVPGAPRLLATGEVRIDTRPWSAGLVGRFLGPRPLTHGATAAASHVFDAIAAYTHRRWTLSLQVDNLLGTNWNEGEYHFASRWDLAQPRSELPRVHISPGRPFGVRAGATLTF